MSPDTYHDIYGELMKGKQLVIPFKSVRAHVLQMNGQQASAFNQDIGSWNTAQVTDMDSMFYSASAFNHDISSWTGTAATTAQTSMFSGATAFQDKFTCTNAITGPASSCVPEVDAERRWIRYLNYRVLIL